MTLLTPSRPARGCGRPATCSKSNRPAVLLALCALQLWGNIPQKRYLSGGYFVGEFCSPFPPPLHPFFGLYSKQDISYFVVGKLHLQASIHNSISIPLISLKNLKSLITISSTPPLSTTTTSFPATRKVSQRPRKLQIGPRSNQSLSLQG